MKSEGACPEVLRESHGLDWSRQGNASTITIQPPRRVGCSTCAVWCTRDPIHCKGAGLRTLKLLANACYVKLCHAFLYSPFLIKHVLSNFVSRS